MAVIDADAHVIENESTWDYMLESERRFKPKIVGATNGDPSVDYWLIDGRLMPRSNVEKKLPEAARDMSDLSIRIKHMDELNIDLQVIYPTIFIFPTARRPEVDLALCRSYNRWMADIVEKRLQRFRWVVVPPLLNMDRVAEELKFGKEHGACGVYLKRLGSRPPLERFRTFFRCMTRRANSICRFAFIRPTAVSNRTTFFSMSRASANSSWLWSAHFTPFWSMASRKSSPSCGLPLSKSARNGFLMRSMIWRGRYQRRGKQLGSHVLEGSPSLCHLPDRRRSRVHSRVCRRK